MDYNKMHADWAMQHQSVKGKRVLVVGCNSGLDCRYFVEAGAKAVHGLDIDDDIGRDYQHPIVQYFKESAEAMSFKNDTYDLVYCFATMEHVPNIDAAFNEMARVTKPNGLIYCIASPLWNSRQGHHYPQYFADFPWAHLRLSQEQALQYLIDNDIEIAPENGDQAEVANYMYDRANFNMTPSPNYISACKGLKHFYIIRNDLDRHPEDMLDPKIKIELEAKGYKSEDLRAVTHTYIGRKKSKRWARNMIHRLYLVGRRLRNRVSSIKAMVLGRFKA
jgi:ubiquinone/menaquinone biosynthesis C-methylase UbiE